MNFKRMSRAQTSRKCLSGFSYFLFLFFSICQLSVNPIQTSLLDSIFLSLISPSNKKIIMCFSNKSLIISNSMQLFNQSFFLSGT